MPWNVPTIQRFPDLSNNVAKNSPVARIPANVGIEAAEREK